MLGEESVSQVERTVCIATRAEPLFLSSDEQAEEQYGFISDTLATLLSDIVVRRAAAGQSITIVASISIVGAQELP